jgi:hypothetical protein
VTLQSGPPPFTGEGDRRRRWRGCRLNDAIESGDQAGLDQHVIGLNAEYPNPGFSEPLRSALIAELLINVIMHRTIELNTQLRQGAVEIQDVGTDRMLPAEAQVAQLFAPQQGP